MNTHSKSAKGSIRKFEVAACAWIDLLGYGNMLVDVEYDPTTQEAIKPVERLYNYHSFISTFSNSHFPMLAMNDGVVIFKDLSPRTNSVTYDFISRCIKLFDGVNRLDLSQGFYGARMIIATGFRVRVGKISVSESNKGKSLLTKINKKSISVTQAIYEALAARPSFGVVPELQGNFAFTKAYLVDRTGSKGGFGGNNCYIDYNFFAHKTPPDWITFENVIQWTEKGLKGNFGKFLSIDSEKAGELKFKGLLDTYDVAKNITNDNEVTKRIINSRIRNIVRNALS
jgi:hypothetical protein